MGGKSIADPKKGLRLSSAEALKGRQSVRGWSGLYKPLEEMTNL